MPKILIGDAAMVALIVAATCPLSGIQEHEAKAEFEVASVKVAQSTLGASRGGIGPWNVKAGPDSLVMTNVTLRMLIHYAYHLPGYPDSDNRISGGPTWLDSATFDINAKAPGKASREELNLMLRPLLADRFQLQFHWLTKDVALYALVIGKGGIKFREADPDHPTTNALAHVAMGSQSFSPQVSSLTTRPQWIRRG